MVSHENIDDTTSISRYEEVARLSADVSLVYPDMLANPENLTGYSAELGSLDDSRIAQLVKKAIEYRQRFATGTNDKLFDIPVNPRHPNYIKNRYLAPAKREQYKLVALSTLLETGTLFEKALKQALERVQGEEFLEYSFHEAIGVVTDYAHEGQVDRRQGGSGLV